MKISVLLLFLCFAQNLVAQNMDSNNDTLAKVSIREYQTMEVSQAPTIDGLLDEKIWDLVDWQTDFTVNSPNNGDIPKRQTKFKILYDNDNLYFGARCFDENPNDIESRLGRRDNFPGDWVEINIDSYGDKSTAFSFTSSVSGVKGDEFVTNNGNNWDTNWNPIWYLKTNIDEEGWTAEVKIPLSQLRFGKQEVQEWGIQVMRRDFRADERSTWQFISNNASGWVSNFGSLEGINGIKPKRQIEIQPYILGEYETFKKIEGNPFADGTRSKFNYGLDGKIGLTNDITMDFTFNPDFGQVEADPSRLNLDGFQIFFNEQRPFFVENNNLFSFQVTGSEAGGGYDSDNLFYSRRIGSRPRGRVDFSDDAFTNRPNFTKILGSAKVSGKTRDGWSVGIMESVTAEESIKIEESGETVEKVVEPLSNFFVGRLSKDFNEGASRLGFTLTSVYRDLDGTSLENQFHSDALTGGINLLHTWQDREWQIKGSMIFSEVKGSSQKITETQESFEHYFQRPDADYLGVDSTLTSLNGNGGSLSLANYWGEDNMSFESGVTWRSKGLELNDVGFLNTADEINYFMWAAYRLPKSTKTFRSFQLNYNHWSRWTGGGEHLYLAVNANARGSFQNYTTLRMGINFELKDISQKALFGGPLLRRAPGFYKFINGDSDSRKNFTYGFNIGRFDAIGSDKGSVIVQNYSIWLAYQFSDALRLTMNPSYSQQDRKIQNVAFEKTSLGDRYITGTLKQQTFSSSIRLNYSLTPNLTLEYWGQPFVSIGNFKDFKYITESTNPDFEKRFHLYDENEISFDALEDHYSVTEGVNEVKYGFDNPDFNFIEFRSNMVLRWEYKPGSELFLVWSQSSSNLADPSKDIFTTLQDDLFNEKPRNIFLLKATYRFH